MNVLCVLDAEEEGHHEKGPSKVLKKVKEKAKKIKNVLTKHGHGHGHEHDRGGEQHIPDDHDLDEEDTEDYDVGQQVHGGAPGLPLPYYKLHFKSSLCFGINTVDWICFGSARKSTSRF